MRNRWAIYIDIEGFSELFKCERFDIIRSLCDLMEAIFLIGERCTEENRIFAHQIVDGFTIVGNYNGLSLEMPVAIAISILRHVAVSGRFAKASIGEGDSGDYTGHYPNRVLDAQENGHRVRMGSGLLTLFPVLGTAHIDAYRVHEKSPSGSLLTVASSNRNKLPQNTIVKEVSCGTLLSIDWVHSEINLVNEIQRSANLRSPNIKEIEQAFLNYKSHKNPPPPHWIKSTWELLNLSI
jgi:hypothetical protein